MSVTGRVVLIDRQDYWRQRCASALEDSGYAVLQLASYDCGKALPSPEAADLVVLCCTTVGAAEVRLIAEIRRCGEPLLLMCTLPEAVGVRAGFAAGAIDVVERPYEAEAIVTTVGHALDGTAGPRPARGSLR